MPAAPTDTLGSMRNEARPPSPSRKRTRSALAALAVLALVACGERHDSKMFSSAPALPAAVFAATEPSGAREVGDVRASAKEGERVVVRGRVGGEHDPIVLGSAVFTLADIDKLEVCDAGVCMTCETPWDACCATSDRVVANTLTVRVLGPDGKPLAADVTRSGVSPLAIVVVTGRVGPRTDPKVLVVDAEQLFVVKR